MIGESVRHPDLNWNRVAKGHWDCCCRCVPKTKEDHEDERTAVWETESCDQITSHPHPADLLDSRDQSSPKLSFGCKLRHLLL